MKKLLIPIAVSAALLAGCDVDQTKETKLPDVDVDVAVDAEAGQLPEFDVDWADIDVGTRTEIVEVPSVVIVMEEVEVEVPYIDVDMPNEGPMEERTILVEAEVSDVEHDLSIHKIYASQKNLIVVSELKAMTTSLADKKMRVSDQLVLNAPDLNVKHYIIGERPDRVFNTQHTYVRSHADLKAKLKDYRVIYSK